MMEIDVLACRGCGKYIGCTCLTLEQHEAHIATLETQLSEAREELVSVLDMADEAYRKYAGEAFNGFDADDVSVLQAARDYWLDSGGLAEITAAAIEAGAYTERTTHE
ncbi:hypothetical protein UFOVP368_33 [uncultured Caudovirales phage]|uniref:Coil containing protein n=1 Tax=uncultured Caudovirales phage TaxID=2100421 RepID=A0A6J7WXM1_9CAUD|nr:hypothetical protein UFOVP368_33 [uncultured Caudovirales phage]